MNNLERIQMEVKDINLTVEELNIFCLENGLDPSAEYQAGNHISQRAVYSTTLSILESIANNPNNFKNIKMDDMSVTQFSENLQKRIYHLVRKLRTMQTNPDNTNVFNLFL